MCLHADGLTPYKPGTSIEAVDEGPAGAEVEYRCPAGYRKEDRLETGELDTPIDVDGNTNKDVSSVLDFVNLDFEGRITCVKCPVGQYPGPGWECKRCPELTKWYQPSSNVDGGVWRPTCQCKPQYVPEGPAGQEGCVAAEDERALQGVVQGGELEKADTMRFRSVVDAEGELKSRYADWKPQEVRSAVLSSYFTLSAVGCWQLGKP